MLFNSYLFLLLFLPVFLSGYFFLNRFGHRNLALLFLCTMSLWFYGYADPNCLPVILGSVFLNHLLARILDTLEKPLLRKGLLVLSIAANLAILFYFKYFSFFLKNVNRFLGTAFPLPSLLLPLGISFFTFQQIAYLADIYRKEAAPYPFLQYASFITYFPKVSQGPIASHQILVPQFLKEENRHFCWDSFARGLFLFTLGLSKKVLIADVFGAAATWGFSNVPVLDTTNALFACLAYTIQIYFDFSGYCDMALGIGKMMNIDLPINFNSPYKALTILDFWKRWHMTLTQFFTKYIYIPLGGNRKGILRTYCNVMVVFLASGLWHGANWTFLLWGILHGLFSVITRKFRSFFDRLHPAASWLITFVFLNATWILFRANTVADAIRFLHKLLLLDFGPLSSELVSAFQLPELMFLTRHIPGLSVFADHPTALLTFFYGGAMSLILGPRNAQSLAETFKPSFVSFLLITLLLVWCILSMSGVSTFLYFNF